LKKELPKSEPLQLATNIEYADGAIVSRTIIKQAKGNVSLFAFDEGEELSEHTAPFDALVQIIDGTAEITIDSRSYDLESGASIIMPANIPHALKANTPFKMVLTMIKD
jgi:quercetin dioxygenase-like cupin family protein